MRGHCILSHGFESGPDATKVTALADRTKSVDDDQLAAIIREELATALTVSAPAGAGRGDVTCH